MTERASQVTCSTHCPENRRRICAIIASAEGEGLLYGNFAPPPSIDRAAAEDSDVCPSGPQVVEQPRGDLIGRIGEKLGLELRERIYLCGKEVVQQSLSKPVESI